MSTWADGGMPPESWMFLVPDNQTGISHPGCFSLLRYLTTHSASAGKRDNTEIARGFHPAVRPRHILFRTTPHRPLSAESRVDAGSLIRISMHCAVCMIQDRSSE